METVSPIPSEEPTPAESVPPVPSEEPTPVESVPPAPSEEPMPTERETPELSPEPSDAAKKTGAAGNTEALLGEAPTASTYSINVPIGMEGLFFKLTADLDLSNYDGGSGGGASYYWTPIGILSSFDANSVPSGTPFLGTFDGGGHTVTGFQYAPDPDRIAADSTDSMSGYGLFGYVGTGGAVKNLNFKMTRSDGVTALPWVLSNSLGGENYAVGVVAAASSGGISGCTVTQADLSYTVAADGSAISCVGGIAGLVYVGNVSTSVDSCIFLGKIANTLAGTSNTAAYANQRVGGIAGALGIAVATTPLSKCAAGVDIDIHNGSSMSNTGGVGGLVGYCSGSNPNTNITGCFTTGAIYVKHTAGGLIGRNNTKLFLRDSFSTVALGVTAKNIPNADFTLNTVESIGGLIGNRAQNATTLTNVYFAGGLLAPQFGAVAGWQICNSATLGLINVAVDDTQAPHALAKYSEPAIDNSLLIRDWNTFTANAGAAWSAADTTYLPQLKWARDSDSAVIQTLSQAAAKRWVTLSSANAVKGSDGTYSLYRLKDVSGAAPAALGDLTRTTDYKADGVIVGGIYTGSATVSGTSVPAARWAVTAANQAEGNANLIDTGENFLRFLNRANLAGGGYLGADFTLSGAISGTAIPAYSGTFFPFCGSLTGETGSSLSALAYPKGATGLFNTAFSATFQNLTFNNITIGNVSLGASGSLYFGLLAGRIASSALNNVDVNSFSYTYQDPSSGSYYQSNITPIGLVGTIPSESVSTVFTNCDVAGLAVNIKARTNANSSLRVYVGGLLGSNSSSSLSIADCTVSGAISATLSSNSTSNNLAYVGGFVGYDSGNIIVTGGRVFANLVGGTAGGLLGRGAPSALTNCLFSGSVSTTDFSTSTTATSAAAGGLVGYNTRAVTIEQCAVFGSVTSRYYAGGLLGYSSTNPTIRSSYASAIVSAAAAGGAAGGLVGYAPRVLMNTAGMPSYFVGQVWAPGPYGVFAGQTTNVNASLLANSVYDSTLTQRGIALVGSYVTAPTGGAAAKPGAAAWTTLAPTNSTIWSYAAGARSYPQLKWMSDSTDASVREISRVSTYQLFDNPSTITSLYSMAPAHPFSVTLPAGISASAATPNSFVQSGVSGSTTTYTVTGTEDEGPLKFTYSGVTAGGSPLSLSYTIAKQSFDYGEGTASKPFIIYNLDQLEIFRDFVDSGKNSVGVYYQISEAPMSASDDFSALGPVTIDMGSLVWSGTLASLAGQLDGHGSTLQNLTTSGWTNSQGTWSAGLLGGLGDGSSVKDLTITGAEINGLSNSGSTSAAGILSATARGATVTNVRVDGVISAGRNVAVGGLVGSSVGPLTLADCRTDVAITALGGDGADAIGAGGLVGSMSGVGNAKANISQCAAQGSIVDWGGVGGLVGYVNGSAFTLIITNSYSLVNFSDTGASGSVQAGGFLGRVVNVNGGTNQNYYIKIDSCYYAGENNLSTASTRYRGGFVGGASSSSATATGYGNLHILNCAYNTDGSDIDARANLSYSGTFTPAYYWSKADTGTALPGLAWVGDSPAFQMSQGSPQGVMADWNPSVWSFADGFYPHLSGDTAWSGADTRLAHLAIHYTKAARGTRNFSNVFVRADGAALSTTASPTVVRVTGNGRMAVATCPDLGPSVSLTVTLDGAARTVSFTPSTNSSGNRDVSIYYINPDGMWEDKVWLVYTADALAGLSTMFSADAADLNGLSRPALSTLSGGEVRLGKDIDLGISYSGMGDYDTWRPIGSNAFPFSTTFSGGGKTLYNLAVNPFYYGADLSDASLGLFGVVGIGGTVKNLNLAANATADEASFYRQPGVRVAQGVSTAGALTGVLAGGRLENCLVSIPVYTLADTPADPGYADDWSAVPYLGASFSASLGGLVGKVTEDSSIVNCGYTGYVYADPKAPRPGSDSPVPDGQTTGPVGGLVGSVATGKALTVKSSYAASYVGGSTAGALVGDAAGALHLDGVCYDANALAGDISPVGRGLVTSGTVSSAIPAELGDGWIPDTPDGLYPLQSSLSASPDTLAGRMRISLSPNAGSATSGTLLYSDGTLACSATQPGVSVIPGTAVVTGGKTFVKTVDGLTQLELQQSSAARRVLINLRCWYDDVKLVDGVRHYTITTAEELWELGQIVSGGITDSGISKVAHTHAPSGGYDDFSGAVVHLAADIDLTKLTDQVSGVAVQRAWSPIGTEERPFNGTLEGGGHLVFGMLSNPVAGTQGLFGTVSGTVENLLVSGASLKLPTGGTGGVLAARLTGTGSLLFCGVSGSVSAEGEGVTAGGLAGSSAGTITGSFSTAELSTAGAVSSGALGGLVGSLSGGGITQSYFTGFVNAPYASAVGGIAAEQTGGAVSHCYVSAYLDGTVVYRISKTFGDDCRYDGRHLSKGTGGTRQDGVALAMAGTGWTPGNGEHYPFPARFSPDGGIPDLSATSLGAAAKLAAAIFIFGGSTGGANYARFQTVTAPSLAAAGYSLRSGNPT
ncbi:MAG TPA: hypothetical protein VN421_01775, partial [Pseudoflavonifractor sp.]|nr:hypothetical protein [Pseudoflavonifractor sp.]